MYVHAHTHSHTHTHIYIYIYIYIYIQCKVLCIYKKSICKQLINVFFISLFDPPKMVPAGTKSILEKYDTF